MNYSGSGTGVPNAIKSTPVVNDVALRLWYVRSIRKSSPLVIELALELL